MTSVKKTWLGTVARGILTALLVLHTACTGNKRQSSNGEGDAVRAVGSPTEVLAAATIPNYRQLLNRITAALENDVSPHEGKFLETVNLALGNTPDSSLSESLSAMIVQSYLLIAHGACGALADKPNILSTKYGIYSQVSFADQRDRFIAMGIRVLSNGIGIPETASSTTFADARKTLNAQFDQLRVITPSPEFKPAFVSICAAALTASLTTGY